MPPSDDLRYLAIIQSFQESATRKCPCYVGRATLLLPLHYNPAAAAVPPRVNPPLDVHGQDGDNANLWTDTIHLGLGTSEWLRTHLQQTNEDHRWHADGGNLLPMCNSRHRT